MFQILDAFRRDGAKDKDDLPDDIAICDIAICDIAIYADDNTIYSKCGRASDLWQQLEFASELESDLRDTVDWGKK